MKIEKNNYEENKPKSIAKKLSFLWVILGAGVVHFGVKSIEIDSALENSFLFIFWITSLLISGYFYSYFFDKKFRERWDSYDSGEFDLLNGEPNSNMVQLDRTGELAIAKVDKVIIRYLTSSPSVTGIYVVEYSFVHEAESFRKTKKILEQYYNFDPNPPKQGDFIEIKYDKSNPDNSIIVHDLADKVKWYQLQKKYKIKIINKTNQ